MKFDLKQERRRKQERKVKEARERPSEGK